MAPALTPALALDYVRELSADVRATIVLDAAGRLLAGPQQLADPARALLAAGGDAAELEAVSAAGVVCAVRSPGHAAVAVCGRFAMPGVVRQDLRAAVAALEGRPPAAGGHDRLLPPAAPAPAPAPASAPTHAHAAAPANAAAAPGDSGAAPADPLADAAEGLISAFQSAFAA
jgi:hypothetical protein